MIRWIESIKVYLLFWRKYRLYVKITARLKKINDLYMLVGSNKRHSYPTGIDLYKLPIRSVERIYAQVVEEHRKLRHSVAAKEPV